MGEQIIPLRSSVRAIATDGLSLFLAAILPLMDGREVYRYGDLLLIEARTNKLNS